MALTFVKLDINFFQNPKIQRISRMPGGDTYIKIYVALLTMAMKSPAPGMIMISDTMAAEVSDIAGHCLAKEDEVKAALSVFRRLNMVEINNEVIILPSFEEHQNLGKIKAAREKARLRVANYREKHRLQIGVTRTKRERNAIGNGTVTKSNAGDLDLDLDKDVDKEEEKNGAPLSGGALLLKIIIDLRKGGRCGGIPATAANGKFTAAHARLYGKNARFQLEAIAEADGTELAGRVFAWGAQDKFWGGHELHAGIYERLKAGYIHSQEESEDPLIKSMKQSAELLGGRK